jgi:hypothetical protein
MTICWLKDTILFHSPSFCYVYGTHVPLSNNGLKINSFHAFDNLNFFVRINATFLTDTIYYLYNVFRQRTLAFIM